MNRQCWTLLAGALLLGSTVAHGQAAKVTLFRDLGFAGPAITVTRPNADMGRRFPVQSVEVGAGAWKLCPQANFRGNCITVKQSTPNLNRSHGWRGYAQSIQPVVPDAGKKAADKADKPG